MTKPFITLLFILFSFTLPAHSHERTSSNPTTNSTRHALRVGVIINQAPFSYINKKGEYKGVSVKIWQEIAKKLKLSYKFIPIKSSFDAAVNAVKDEKLDALVGPVSVTHKRIQLVDFSRPYFLDKIGAAVTKKSHSFLYIISTIFGQALFFMLAAFFILLIIFGFILWLIEHKKHDAISNRAIKGLGDTVWITITSFLRDLIFEPATTRGRIIIVIWLFISVFFMSVITAVITSSLTVALTAKTSAYKNISDLVNKEFAVEKESATVSIAARTGALLVDTDSLLAGLKLVQEGKIQGVIGNYYLLQYQIKSNQFSKIKMSSIFITNDEYAFVFPKGGNLVEKVDAALTHLQENGNAAQACINFIDKEHAHSCEF